MNVDADFLDREYNPRVQIPQFADFFVRWKQDAQKTRESQPARLDLVYGEAAAETLDFFPASRAGAPPGGCGSPHVRVRAPHGGRGSPSRQKR